ncbi:hypothetical protein [Peribacillus simplex]|uniref:Protein kinase domain-containing protein n=2 Tax=Peribacillus simplex TaxID=1478 RepID=A0A223ECK2_9BACI|nr:hypothetical protein [Peribacillus simplex]ASS92921.1 hypothetical protein BS1321_02400 [Peribacillus simplex NBRC 15720 = DSM 1321]MEC1398121.1 hypothetical protein [Peribacillus simplex]TVX84247.1 hypothetical protein FQP34_03280 [Peribacillus simplex]
MWSITNDKERIHQPNKSTMLSRQEIKAIESWISQMGKFQFYKTAGQKMSTARKTLKFKYKILGHGFNRVVYDLNNGYILKVAFSEVGLISNANEAYIYNNCNKEVKEYFCPVKEYGTGWIIMKKVDTKVPFAIKEYTKLIKLELKFLRYGIIPIDLRLENVGYNENDEMVVIDYGLFTLDLKSPVLRWLV